MQAVVIRTLAICSLLSLPVHADAHFGFFAGGALGVVGMEVESDRYWLALDSPLGGTALFAAIDDNPRDAFYGVGFGAGLRFRIGDQPRVFLVPLLAGGYLRRIVDETDVGVNISSWSGGAGVGVHAAWSNGVIVQVNIPVVGYAVDEIGTNRGLTWYIVASILTMPVAVVGYRW